MILLIVVVLILAGCASFSLVSTQRSPQIPELADAQKLGLLVLVDYSGYPGLLMGKDEINDEPTSWVTGSYDPLMNGSVKLKALRRDIEEKYLPPGAASLFITESLTELLGNGPNYTYSYSLGFSLKPFMVSNNITEDGQSIEGPQIIPVDSDLSYHAEDRDLIPLALRYGKEAGIDALVVVRLDIFTEAGQLTSLPDDGFGGSLEFETGTPLNVGDYFVRTEVYPDNMMVIDAESGVVLADYYSEITGAWVGGSKKFHRVEASRPEDLIRFLHSDDFGRMMAESAKIEASVLVPYLRDHYWAEAVRN